MFILLFYSSLVIVAVANEKDTRFGHVKPPKVTICRIFKALRRSEFCSYYPCDIPFVLVVLVIAVMIRF